jgi:hypothetical protein
MSTRPRRKVMAKVLVGPNGMRIRGTLERVLGVALIQSATMKRGKLDYEYEGETEIFWDGQETVTDEKGETVFVDVEGNEWPESELRLREVPDDE